MTGFKPERLISQAMDRGVVLRRICFVDETEITFVVDGDGLEIIGGLAGSRYRLEIIDEGGMKPAVQRLKKSKLAAAGLLLFVLVYLSQTLFVREINVIGCQSITEDSIRAAIAEEGLYEGAMKRFDCDAIERKLFSLFDDIVWAKVAYEGGYVQVEISESEQVDTAGAEQQTACHIVAEQDCYIENISVFSGRGAVQTDDFVRKGEILISGIVPIEHPSFTPEEGQAMEHYVHAAGEVTARVPYYFSFTMDRLPTDADADTAADADADAGADPEEGVSEEEKQQAGALLRAWIKENIPESAEILKKNFHFDVKNNIIIRVCGTIETRQQVGVEKEISIDTDERRTEEDTD